MSQGGDGCASLVVYGPTGTGKTHLLESTYAAFRRDHPRRRALLLSAAQKFDSGERCDMEAGMAKLFASETAMEIALDAVRIHGGYGYSTEYDVERYFRDAPLMIVGEGTNEIQKNVIAKQLVKRGGLDL